MAISLYLRWPAAETWLWLNQACSSVELFIGNDVSFYRIIKQEIWHSSIVWHKCTWQIFRIGTARYAEGL